MKRIVSHVRRPVKRRRADTYLLITLLSFAASVSLTRIFLSLTGYPQLGGGELHIAHVLWGGLFLFVAALIPLIISNRSVYIAGALVAGVGMGLFIDEVGKFITQSNDYFFPAAAPIVYAIFLLVVLLYTRVRRVPHRSPRAELYRALDDLEELLDYDLDSDEREDLERRLRYVAEHDAGGDLGKLAGHILEVISEPDLQLAPDTESILERARLRLTAIETRWFSRRVTKTLIVIALLSIGGSALYRMLVLFQPQLVAGQIQTLIELGRLESTRGVAWYTVREALEGCTGVLMVSSAALFVFGRDDHAVGIGYLGLLLALTTVDLVVFYFEQFGTIFRASSQFVLLMMILRYRQRFLRPSRPPAAAGPV